MTEEELRRGPEPPEPEPEPEVIVPPVADLPAPEPEVTLAPDVFHYRLSDGELHTHNGPKFRTLTEFLKFESSTFLAIIGFRNERIAILRRLRFQERPLRQRQEPQTHQPTEADLYARESLRVQQGMLQAQTDTVRTNIFLTHNQNGQCMCAMCQGLRLRGLR